jgi:hypothetical protein
LGGREAPNDSDPARCIKVYIAAHFPPPLLVRREEASVVRCCITRAVVDASESTVCPVDSGARLRSAARRAPTLPPRTASGCGSAVRWRLRRLRASMRSAHSLPVLTWSTHSVLRCAALRWTQCSADLVAPALAEDSQLCSWLAMGTSKARKTRPRRSAKGLWTRTCAKSRRARPQPAAAGSFPSAGRRRAPFSRTLSLSVLGGAAGAAG